jgi:hypothetical protein
MCHYPSGIRHWVDGPKLVTIAGEYSSLFKIAISNIAIISTQKIVWCGFWHGLQGHRPLPLAKLIGVIASRNSESAVGDFRFFISFFFFPIVFYLFYVLFLGSQGG